MSGWASHGSAPRSLPNRPTARARHVTAAFGAGLPPPTSPTVGPAPRFHPRNASKCHPATVPPRFPNCSAHQQLPRPNSQPAALVILSFLFGRKERNVLDRLAGERRPRRSESGSSVRAQGRSDSDRVGSRGGTFPAARATAPSSIRTPQHTTVHRLGFAPSLSSPLLHSSHARPI